MNYNRAAMKRLRAGLHKDTSSMNYGCAAMNYDVKPRYQDLTRGEQGRLERNKGDGRGAVTSFAIRRAR